MFNFSIEKTKKQSVFTENVYWDLLIIGGGPAGLNAALYGKRKGMNVGILTMDLGGQLHTTNAVENYLGFSLVNGSDLANEFTNHVKTLDIPIYQESHVEEVLKTGNDFLVKLADGLELRAKTVLLATGAKPRKLSIPGEAEFANKGVSYCATCDAPFYKEQHVIVVGGGNSAAEAVIDLSKWASKITVIVRSTWKADQILIDQIEKIPFVSIHFNTDILEVYGDIKMEGIKIFERDAKQELSIAADGMFVEIGVIPTSELANGLAKVNSSNEIIVDENQMTSVAGLFAAGDVTNQPFKQIIIAAAEGAKAIYGIVQYLNKKF